jgi:hypothetical protein
MSAREPARRQRSRVIGALKDFFAAILLVVLASFAWYTFASYQSFTANHDSTTGRVVKSEIICGGHICTPKTTVEFVTAAGRAMRVSVSNESRSVGESVTVYYSVDDPSYVELSIGPYYHFQIFFTIGVSICCWLALAGRLIGRWRVCYTNFRRRPPGSQPAPVTVPPGLMTMR